MALPLACIAVGDQLKIEANWPEAGQQLQAEQITVQNVTPAIKSAPSDTIAYLLNDDLEHTRNMIALLRDGTLEPIAHLNASATVESLPFFSGEQPHFLISSHLPHCERQLLGHYEPDQGVTGQWLTPTNSARWIWRIDRQAPMFIDQADGQQDGSPFLGWNLKNERLVSANGWFQGRYIGDLDLDSRGILPNVRFHYRPLRSHTLSPAGDWLAYLGGTLNADGPPNKVGVLGLSENVDQTLIRVEAGQGLSPPVWSLNLDQPALAALSGPVDDDEFDPIRLVKALPAEPNGFSIVAEVTAGLDVEFATPIFCTDGAMMYQTKQQGQYHLQKQQPGSQAETLLVQDSSFQPLAC